MPSVGIQAGGCQQGIDAPYGTNCPMAAWVDAMVANDSSPAKVVMDVGCNKGNDAVEWLERWASTEKLFWSGKKWVDYYQQQFNVSKDHGYACHWEESTPRAVEMYALSKPATPKTETQPMVICVEASEGAVGLLNAASVALGYKGKTEFGSLEIVHAAVVDKVPPSGTLEFPKSDASNPGSEVLGINQSSAGLTVPVPAKTVDDILVDFGLTKLDILTIDVEGADPAVLRGATKALSLARYVEFEVHRDLATTAWGSTTLASVVGALDHQGFDCYWAGNNGKLLSMKRCWTENFERGAWGNAACVKRNDPWFAVLEKFAG